MQPFMYRQLFTGGVSQVVRIAGFLCAKFLSDKLGRKKCLMLVSMLQIVSSCCVYFCSSFSTLMVAASLSNMIACMVMVPSYSLLSEISTIARRDQLNSFNTCCVNAGQLIGLSLGLVVPVQYFYFIPCVPTLIFLILSWRLPESPVWLMRRGKAQEARTNLQCVRGDDYDITPEIDEIQDVINKESLARESHNSRSRSRSVKMRIQDSRSFLLPLGITCVLFVFQATCGIDLLNNYTAIIFKKSSIKPEFLAIIFQVKPILNPDSFYLSIF